MACSESTKKRKLCINGVKVSELHGYKSGEKNKAGSKFRMLFADNTYPKRNLGFNRNRQVTSDSEDDFDQPEGGLMYEYDRGSGSSAPAELKKFADLAISSYNKRELKKYGLVDIVKASKFLVGGFYYCMTFTAKLPCEEDADALTFEAKIYHGIGKCKVDSVRVVDAGAVSPVCCCC